MTTNKNHTGLIIAGIAATLVAAGVAYLYLTDDGEEIRDNLAVKIKEGAKELASGLISNVTSISKETVKKWPTWSLDKMAEPITLPVVFEDGTTKDIQLTPGHQEQDKHVFMLSNNGATIGSLSFSTDYHEWQHNGPLTQFEQTQIAGFIQNYMDTEWDN